MCRGAVTARIAAVLPVRYAPGRSAGMLADAVVPISYAVKGGRPCHAAAAVQDRRARERRRAGPSLQALMLVFLHDHARCLWRHAAMPPPTRLAVVPSGQGRPGAHPLLRLLVRR